MVTAINDRAARMAALEAGAEDFLSKPVDRAELCVRVRNLLRLKLYGQYYNNYSQTLEAEVVTRTTEVERRARLLEQQSETLAQQAALLDLTQDAVIVRDMQGRILFWSRGAEVMTGWPREEAVGRIAFDLLKSVFPGPLAEIYATLLSAGVWEGEVILTKRDGTRLIVDSRWAVQRDADGTPVRLLSINTDISSRKQADAERSLLTERLSLATRVAQVGVWEWNAADNTFIWDDTMFEFYGMPTVKPLPYGLWSGAVHPEDLPAVEASLRATVTTKGSSQVEFRIRRPDGVLRTIAAMERALLNEEGEVTGVVGVHKDVTDRRVAEEILKESGAAQLRFKDEFLSHVSHELRSPLTAIKQFTGILAGGLAGGLNSEQLEYQQIVVRNVAQLQAMIDDLLEVTRLETGKLTVEAENVSVADAVSDALNTLKFSALAKGVTLTSELEPALPSAYADSTRLRQILIILLDNAIKFTADVGSVVVRAQRSPRDPSLLRISVSDNGCGIKPEVAGRIFDRLYQLDSAQAARKGLGLGLYICKELVSRQGGELWLDSSSGAGSTFTFTLPVFDLRTLIAPLLHKGRWPTEAASLVVVTAGQPGVGSGIKAGDDWCLQLAGVLRRCLLPNLDVLLPTVRGTDGSARLFVVVFADEPGSVVLARRIHLQLERYHAERPGGPSTCVSYRMLPVMTPAVGEDDDAMATSMVARIEAGIREGEARDTWIDASRPPCEMSVTGDAAPRKAKS
jgi:PAS domain S-box-containing protein